MTRTNEFHSRLSDIGIGPGDVVFVHSGMKWIGGGLTAGAAIIEALIDLVGSNGTICMPSYSWRYPQSLRPAENSVVDLKRTPALVGLLPEIFRRRPGVRRSASYWLPICALGQRAEEILANQHTVVDPFGSGSTLRRVMELGGKTVGLGVFLGASSLSHLPDHDLAPFYPIDVFSQNLLSGDVVDVEGIRLRVKSITIREEIIAKYTPSAMFAESDLLRSQLNFAKWGDAYAFSYPSRTYWEEAVALGGEYLKTGRLPPWLTGPRWLPPRAG